MVTGVFSRPCPSPEHDRSLTPSSLPSSSEVAASPFNRSARLAGVAPTLRRKTTRPS